MCPGNAVVEVCDIVESTITDTSSQIENDLEVSIYDDLPGEITTPDITAPDLLGTGQLTQPVIIRTVAVGVVDTATASDIAASTVGFVPQVCLLTTFSSSHHFFIPSLLPLP